jgi:hypothetical protein
MIDPEEDDDENACYEEAIRREYEAECKLLMLETQMDIERDERN